MKPIIYSHAAEGVVRYIGRTKKPLEVRLAEHLSEARGKKCNHRLNWLRSLSQPPTIAVIEEVLAEDAYFREQYWISLARDYGCRLVNDNDGGPGISNPSSETRKKIRESRLGSRNPGFGKPLGALQRERISTSLRGISRTPETRIKMGLAKLGSLNPMFGKQRTKESVLKGLETARKNQERKKLYGS